MILTLSILFGISMLWFYYIGYRSMHLGAMTIAQGTVAWGPYLQTLEEYPSPLLLTALTKKIIPRYQAWVVEASLYLNIVFVVLVITTSVGILTGLGLTGGNNPILYYFLVTAMMIGAGVATISALTMSKRLQKMVVAHELMINTIGMLNTRDADQLSEEDREYALEFFNFVTSQETWEILTTDEDDGHS